MHYNQNLSKKKGIILLSKEKRTQVYKRISFKIAEFNKTCKTYKNMIFFKAFSVLVILGVMLSKTNSIETANVSIRLV